MLLVAYGLTLYTLAAYRLAVHWFGERLSCCETDGDFRRAVAGVVAAPVAVPLVLVAAVGRLANDEYDAARRWRDAA